MSDTVDCSRIRGRRTKGQVSNEAFSREENLRTNDEQAEAGIGSLC